MSDLSDLGPVSASSMADVDLWTLSDQNNLLGAARIHQAHRTSELEDRAARLHTGAAWAAALPWDDGSRSYDQRRLDRLPTLGIGARRRYRRYAIARGDDLRVLVGSRGHVCELRWDAAEAAWVRTAEHQPDAVLPDAVRLALASLPA